MALSGNFRLAPQLRPAELARAHGWPCTCYEKFVDSPAWGVFVAQSINSRNVSRPFYPRCSISNLSSKRSLTKSNCAKLSWLSFAVALPLSVRPVAFAEPGAIVRHLRALRGRRVPPARRCLGAPVRRAPPQFDAVIGIVAHLKVRGAIDDVFE